MLTARRARRMRQSALPLCGLAMGVSALSCAHALEEQAGEKKALDACDRKLCTMLVEKNAAGEDLKCNLTKTWGKAAIKSAETQATKWGFGDARCTVQLNLSRAELVAALTAPDYKLKAAPHTVDCLIEDEGGTKSDQSHACPQDRVQEWQSGKGSHQSSEDRWSRGRHQRAFRGCSPGRPDRPVPPLDGQVGQSLHRQALRQPARHRCEGPRGQEVARSVRRLRLDFFCR